jgi:hypothetical protein
MAGQTWLPYQVSPWLVGASPWLDSRGTNDQCAPEATRELSKDDRWASENLARHAVSCWSKKGMYVGVGS